MTEDETKETEIKPRTKSSTVMAIGFVLIGLSGVAFFSMLAVPWFPFSTTVRGIIAGTLFAITQGSWWIGVAMIGPAAIKKIKLWFSRRRETAPP